MQVDALACQEQRRTDPQPRIHGRPRRQHRPPVRGGVQQLESHAREGHDQRHRPHRHLQPRVDQRAPNVVQQPERDRQPARSRRAGSDHGEHDQRRPLHHQPAEPTGDLGSPPTGVVATVRSRHEPQVREHERRDAQQEPGDHGIADREGKANEKTSLNSAVHVVYNSVFYAAPVEFGRYKRPFMRPAIQAANGAMARAMETAVKRETDKVL